MNTRINAGGEIGGATAWDSPSTNSPIHHLSSSTITAQTHQQSVRRKNPPASTIASKLKDFMKVNPPVYNGSKIAKDFEEVCKEVMLHDSIDLSRLMVHVQQVKQMKKKHTRAQNRSS
ncbi:hypothetical protein EJD97_006734 [Solanum chilense]|uniref:Uncharacterized protein n=1 Tax=Solanum chilense TaxID=4083 RepID=A0A6N2BV45_SOLCI|nr:hypothetical protein EJD97_006734 [Solanum chilense]